MSKVIRSLGIDIAVFKIEDFQSQLIDMKKKMFCRLVSFKFTFRIYLENPGLK